MHYTLWLDGHLLGETRLAHTNPTNGQRLGGIHPTPYGQELLPRLSGFLETAAGMKRSMPAAAQDRDDADRATRLLRTTPQGHRLEELVRTLGRLELREAGGARAPFHMLIITDIHELSRLSGSFDANQELARGAARYIVSATPVTFRSAVAALAGGTRMRVQPN